MKYLKQDTSCSIMTGIKKAGFSPAQSIGKVINKYLARKTM